MLCQSYIYGLIWSISPLIWYLRQFSSSPCEPLEHGKCILPVLLYHSLCHRKSWATKCAIKWVNKTIFCPSHWNYELSICLFSPLVLFQLIISHMHSATLRPVVCFFVNYFPLLGKIALAIFSCDSPIFAFRVHLEGLHTSLNDRVPGHTFLALLRIMGTAQTCKYLVTVETVNCTNENKVFFIYSNNSKASVSTILNTSS